jgi:hypothetical protein
MRAASRKNDDVDWAADEHVGECKQLGANAASANSENERIIKHNLSASGGEASVNA